MVHEFQEFLKNFTRSFYPQQEGALFLWIMLALLILGVYAVFTHRTELLSRIKSTILVVIGLNFFWAMSICYSALGAPDPALSGALLAGSIASMLLTGFMAGFTFSLVYALEIIHPPEQAVQEHAFEPREMALGFTVALLGVLTMLVLLNSAISEYYRPFTG